MLLEMLAHPCTPTGGSSRHGALLLLLRRVRNTLQRMSCAQRCFLLALAPHRFMFGYCPQEAKVPFSRGIGGTRQFSGQIKTGQTIPLSSLIADGPRMYSFGVAGLL